MTTLQPEQADITQPEQHERRKGRLFGAIFAGCTGLISFLNVAGNPRFESIHTLDVIRLITAGMGFGVSLTLLIMFFKFSGPKSKT